MSKEDLQAQQDVYRAQLLICGRHGLEADQSAAVLRERADRAGVSLHAAALGVLALGMAALDQLNEPHSDR